MNWTDWLPPLAVSYLVGSVPFSYWIGRARGVDIRRVGSGNVGATNVFRSVGTPWGILALVCDMLKGVVAAAGAPLLFPALLGISAPSLGALACGMAAIAGHTWPLTLRFRGGKGVATGAGVLMAVAPGAAAVSLAVWLLVFLVFRMVSLASIVAALAAAASAWGLASPTDSRTVPILMTALGLLVVWRHRSNMRRIRQGVEPRVPLGRRGRSAV